RLGVILAWDVFFCSHRIRSELRCTQSPRYSSPGLAALSTPPSPSVFPAVAALSASSVASSVWERTSVVASERATILSRSSGGSKNSGLGFGGSVTHARNVICLAASSRLIRLLAVSDHCVVSWITWID
ncbi:hypothetical protein EE612_036463, partial [Oryza sativa]